PRPLAVGVLRGPGRWRHGGGRRLRRQRQDRRPPDGAPPRSARPGRDGLPPARRPGRHAGPRPGRPAARPGDRAGDPRAPGVKEGRRADDAPKLPAVPMPVTWVRWRIVALLMAFSFLSWFLRVSMPVAYDERIQYQLSISPEAMGTVYSAF